MSRRVPDDPGLQAARSLENALESLAGFDGPGRALLEVPGERSPESYGANATYVPQ